MSSCKKKKNKTDNQCFKINSRLNQNLAKNIKLYHIIAPSNFSIVENYSQIIPFFENMKNAIFDSQVIFLDMSNVENFTIETILYILAIFDYFENRGVQCSISGNIPRDKKCAEIFQNSGFYRYVKSKSKLTGMDNGSYLQIKSNNIICGETAKEVMKFLIKHLNKSRVELQDLRDILVEMMSNSVEHAYSYSYTKSAKWYLMAMYDSQNNDIKFSFLDIGLGIPRTVYKKYRETFKNIIHKVTPFNTKVEDNFLINSALKGEFRSETKQGYRGNGLPTIYNNSQGDYIKDLIIYSNNGYVNCKNNHREDISSTFRGTLFTWKYI